MVIGSQRVSSARPSCLKPLSMAKMGVWMSPVLGAQGDSRNTWKDTGEGCEGRGTMCLHLLLQAVSKQLHFLGCAVVLPCRNFSPWPDIADKSPEKSFKWFVTEQL